MRTRSAEERVDTASTILDVAERFVQRRGFNGFSYADVAAELSLTKASLHYHFAGKAELGEALVDRYSERFADSLARIDARVKDPLRKLNAYAGLYASVLQQERMCLCGMLAAEYETLPDQMRKSVLRFFEMNEVWLVGVLEAGRLAGKLTFPGAAIETARLVISSLEGAMLVARTKGDVAGFRSSAERLVARVVGVSRTSN